MSRLTNIQIPTDTWIVGTWEEYLQVLDSLSEQKKQELLLLQSYQARNVTC